MTEKDNVRQFLEMFGLHDGEVTEPQVELVQKMLFGEKLQITNHRRSSGKYQAYKKLQEMKEKYTDFLSDYQIPSPIFESSKAHESAKGCSAGKEREPDNGTTLSSVDQPEICETDCIKCKHGFCDGWDKVNCGLIFEGEWPEIDPHTKICKNFEKKGLGTFGGN